MIFDAHARIGTNRDSALSAAELLATMDRAGIDRALVAPSERQISYDNREGNEAVAAAAARSDGRLLAYAVANAWRSDAVDELARARDDGAVALAVDSSLQGFDLMDGLLEPLLEFASKASWPVYIRTGSPPGHLPMPVALIARRHPHLNFIMGRSGATDFWIDAVPALHDAPNLFADTSYAPWDTVLSAMASDPLIGAHRIVFSTDLPYATAVGEVKRIADWPLADDVRSAVYGGNLSRLLGID